jgi:hypothetical protein
VFLGRGDCKNLARRVPRVFLVIIPRHRRDAYDTFRSSSGASMGKWLLSRRDRLIVARHEVPGLEFGHLPKACVWLGSNFRPNGP